MYTLKKMYEGVYGYTSPMDDKTGQELVQKHLKGLCLFDEFPEGAEDNTNKTPEEKADCGCGQKKTVKEPWTRPVEKVKTTRKKKEVVQEETETPDQPEEPTQDNKD